MLLIESDMAHLLIHLEVRQRRWDESITIKTPLGWTLFRNLSSGHCETINSNFLVTDEGTWLQQHVEQFWKVDSYAIKQAVSASALSAEDKRALAILHSHYKTALLWKHEPNLPNNRAMAVSRYPSAEKVLKNRLGYIMPAEF